MHRIAHCRSDNGVHALLLAVAWLLCLLPGVHGQVACTDDATCELRCAGSNTSCTAVCSSLLGTCVCQQGEALRKDGGCSQTEAPVPQNTCVDENYRVTFVVVELETHELTMQDVETNRPSAAFITLARRCTAAALGRGVEDVVDLETTLLPDGANNTADYFGLLAARINFDFCVPAPAIETADLGKEAGEAFSAEASQFVMASFGNMVVLEWKGLGPTQTSSSTAGAAEEEAAQVEGGDDTRGEGAFNALWAALLVLLLLAIAFVLAVWWMLRKRLEALPVAFFPDEPLPSPTGAAGETLEAVLESKLAEEDEQHVLLEEGKFAAHVSSEAAEQPGAADADVVQLPGEAPSTDQLQDSAGKGAEEAAEEENHPYVRAWHHFDFQEIKEGVDPESGVDKHVLSIQKGEVLEVLARGGEWLYGRSCVSGTAGLFPENRVTWLGWPMAMDPTVFGRPQAEDWEADTEEAAQQSALRAAASVVAATAAPDDAPSSVAGSVVASEGANIEVQQDPT